MSERPVLEYYEGVLCLIVCTICFLDVIFALAGFISGADFLFYTGYTIVGSVFFSFGLYTVWSWREVSSKNDLFWKP